MEAIRNFASRIYRACYDAERWVAHRTYDRYHVLKIRGLSPGYYDKDDILLHAAFGVLVDFVECELAWQQQWGEDRPRTRWQRLADHLPRFREFRRPDLGLKHLGWEIGLRLDESMGASPDDPDYGKLSSQAESALEELAIYQWYKNREKRPEPGEASGYFKAFEEHGNLPAEGLADETWQQKVRPLAIRSNEIEEAQHQEDEDMLIRLMKVRRSLWT